MLSTTNIAYTVTCLHHGILHSNEKEQTLLHPTTWMKHAGIMLSERKETQKRPYVIILFIWSSKTGNTTCCVQIVGGEWLEGTWGTFWGWACCYLSICQLHEYFCLKNSLICALFRAVLNFSKKLTYNHKNVKFPEKSLTLICKASFWSPYSHSCPLCNHFTTHPTLPWSQSNPMKI